MPSKTPPKTDVETKVESATVEDVPLDQQLAVSLLAGTDDTDISVEDVRTAKKRRVPTKVDPKERASRLLEINQKIREGWQVKLRASFAEVPEDVHSEALRRIFDQTYLVTARNLFYISKYGRALMSEQDIARAEETISKLIADVHDEFAKKHDQVRSLLVQLAQISAASTSPTQKLYPAQYPVVCDEQGNPVNGMVRVTSPISFAHLKLFWMLDQYMLDLDTLWLNGVRPAREVNNDVFLAKTRMRTLAYNIRTHAKTIQGRYSALQLAKSEIVAGATQHDDLAVDQAPAAELATV